MRFAPVIFCFRFKISQYLKHYARTLCASHFAHAKLSVLSANEQVDEKRILPPTPRRAFHPLAVTFLFLFYNQRKQ